MITIRKIGGILMLGIALFATSASLYAVNQTSSDTLTIQATVYGPAPTTPAVIVKPLNGTHFTVAPQVISGSCGAGLTVKLYNNDTLIGITDCSNDGRFVFNITLLFGANILTTVNYNSLNQFGPESAPILLYLDDEIIEETKVQESKLVDETDIESAENTLQGVFENTIFESLAYSAGIGNTTVTPARPVVATTAFAGGTTLFIDAAFLNMRLSKSTLSSAKRVGRKFKRR